MKDLKTVESLYELIRRSLKDGSLPPGFSLPEEDVVASGAAHNASEDASTDASDGSSGGVSDDSAGDGNGFGKIRFADGALDGITIYHMGREMPDTLGMQQMVLAVRTANTGKLKETDAAFAALGKEYRAVTLIEALPDFIYEHKDDFDPDRMFETGLYLTRYSRDREAVKFGLLILSLFEMKVEAQKDVVRTLALSDEFTLYALVTMVEWENANDEVFRVCKKVRGWGRIHAMERLEPETEEIRDWIFMEGVRNDVAPAYSAFTAWEKADVPSRLAGPLSRAEFDAAGRIFLALLDEGPVLGISLVENAKSWVRTYLEKAEGYFMDEDEAETVEALQEWLRQN